MKEGIMDKNRFDGLAKALAQGTSRRDVLRGMMGGVAAGAAITIMPRSVGAALQDDEDANLEEICAGSGEACEMVEGSCCEPYTCFEGICDIPRGCVGEGLPCVDDFPCCEDEGLTCVDGICAVETEAAGGQIEELPNTGVGDAGGANGWFGVIAAGGAIAAATALRRNREEPVDDRTS
jgi:hypothetical protein